MKSDPHQDDLHDVMYLGVTQPIYLVMKRPAPAMVQNRYLLKAAITMLRTSAWLLIQPGPFRITITRFVDIMNRLKNGQGLGILFCHVRFKPITPFPNPAPKSHPRRLSTNRPPNTMPLPSAVPLQNASLLYTE